MARIAPRIAVVLFNLGGPDRPDAVRPFLFNLFNDPNIIGLPTVARWPLAQLISRRRAPVAREIYAEMGGGSPLLPNTEAQARALEAALVDLGEVRTFIAMRYWHPLTEETVAAVKEFAPDEVVLLPLYPQFSSTTTGSSVRVWKQAASRQGLDAPTRLVCCYPWNDGFVEEAALRVAKAAEALPEGVPARLLFSAHGLPKRTVERGDPYQWQVERSAEQVAERLRERGAMGRFRDWLVCYQSRVGPLEWIGPATDHEIERAGKEGLSLVLTPIAFVSEHSETLVELDIEYGKLAGESGVPHYVRVPTVDDGAAFIDGLAREVRAALSRTRHVCSGAEGRLCPGGFGLCPMGAEGEAKAEIDAPPALESATGPRMTAAR